MHADLLRLAADMARREEPFVLAVVVRRQPASSAQAGDMALVTAAGAFHGWLGGSCTQPTVIREARQALREGKPRLINLAPDPPDPADPADPADPVAGGAGGFGSAAGPGGRAERRPGVTALPMNCASGGSVEIYLEPILPAPRLAVFGVSPTARALARLGKTMGYTVLAVDAAAEPALFPGADQVLTDLASPDLAAAASRGQCYAVVATMGERDEEAVQAALALAPAYLGVVASARRFAQLRQTLLAQGVAAEALDGIRSPAGVAIGAVTPEEIALSVLAEVVQRRRAAAPAGPARPARPAGEMAGEEPLVELDPVCGMTVEVATARHTAGHAGRAYFFCGAGCRERFLAAPERYVPAASPAPAREGAA
ncbi:MAG TPA: XdhC family protein [Thermoanaerobaculia bacterium]|nr:XdhC family protein [Thermoanaerobaculia bacterium]